MSKEPNDNRENYENYENCENSQDLRGSQRELRELLKDLNILKDTKSGLRDVRGTQQELIIFTRITRSQDILTRITRFTKTANIRKGCKGGFKISEGPPRTANFTKITKITKTEKIRKILERPIENYENYENCGNSQRFQEKPQGELLWNQGLQVEQ